jgi:FMN-dependent NADH-azoreductase
MKNILYINACCRENSRTDELAEHLLSILSGNVQSVNLYEENISPLNSQLLLKRDSLLKQGRTDDKSFNLARQFASDDIIVISTPYWDLMFPSVLKVYLANITACGVTFRYSDKGIPESLCKAESLY